MCVESSLWPKIKEYAIYHNSVLLFNILYYILWPFVAIIRYIKEQNTLRKVDFKMNSNYRIIILNNHVNRVVIDYIVFYF